MKTLLDAAALYSFVIITPASASETVYSSLASFTAATGPVTQYDFSPDVNGQVTNPYVLGPETFTSDTYNYAYNDHNDVPYLGSFDNGVTAASTTTALGLDVADY
jgi:hypothetical protein